eukprot:gene4896-5141_t
MPSTFSWQQLEAGMQACGNAVLGCGGFGSVYRGRLQGSAVAIKVLSPDSQQGQQEFDREVAILGSLQHQHLLQLLGTCPERQALVYPLMEGGSLDQRIATADTSEGDHQSVRAAPRRQPRGAAGPSSSSSVAAPSGGGGGDRPPLTWHDRVRITHEVALALLWLHTRTPEPILHLDLKSSNVLLDRSLTAKVSDVGLSMVQSGPQAHTTARHSSSIRGPWAYMAPEYLSQNLLGPFTDVYALGVIMCELLTGKLAEEALTAVHEPFENYNPWIWTS